MNISLIFYNFVLTFIIIIFYPLLSPYLKIRVSKKYKVWIHCASLGEVKIALRLLESLVKRLSIDKSDFLITTTTPTAKDFALSYHKEVTILPLDYYFISKRFINIVKPEIFIIIETEIWPNYISLIKKNKSKIFLLNGRISKNTFILFNIFKWFFKNIISKIDYFLVREEIDYLRFINLGINKEKIKITGNIKYDDLEEFSFDEIRKEEYFNSGDFVISFGSIRESEEKIIIEFVKEFSDKKNIKFILSPRHLNLLKKICKLLDKKNINYQLMTKFNRNYTNFKCLIIDKYGELKKMYKISDVVFVCGTILPYGGQNIIEPASLGKLVVFGRHIQNFLHPAKLLLSNNAAIQVRDLKEFRDIIYNILKNPTNYNAMASKAKLLIQQLSGVTERNVDFIVKYLNEQK